MILFGLQFTLCSNLACEHVLFCWETNPKRDCVTAAEDAAKPYILSHLSVLLKTLGLWSWCHLKMWFRTHSSKQAESKDGKKRKVKSDTLAKQWIMEWGVRLKRKASHQIISVIYSHNALTAIRHTDLWC